MVEGVLVPVWVAGHMLELHQKRLQAPIPVEALELDEWMHCLNACMSMWLLDVTRVSALAEVHLDSAVTRRQNSWWPHSLGFRCEAGSQCSVGALGSGPVMVCGARTHDPVKLSQLGTQTASVPTSPSTGVGNLRPVTTDKVARSRLVAQPQ